MSFHYFLYSIKKYDTINIHLNEIINAYEEMIEYIKIQTDNDETLNKKEEIKVCNMCKSMYKQQLEENMLHCKILTEMCQSLCEHEYVTDLIDLTPDTSKTVEYCSICLSPKPENEYIQKET